MAWVKLPAVVHEVPLPEVDSVQVAPARATRMYSAAPVAAGLSSFLVLTPLTVVAAKACTPVPLWWISKRSQSSASCCTRMPCSW